MITHDRARNRITTDPSPSQIVEKATNLLLRGSYSDALEILHPAVVRHPNNAGILMRYGDALYQKGEISRARDSYRQALALDASLFQAWYGRGLAELSFEAYTDAIECFRRALVLAPRDADVRYHLGSALFQMGEVDAAIDELLRAAKSQKWQRRALRQVAVFIPGSPSRGNRPILEARRKWAALEERFEHPPIARNGRAAGKPAPSGKLRIGYVSSYFTSRNWMKPVWGVINHHDRSRFEIHLFADCGGPDAAGGYKENATDLVHPIKGLANHAVAKQISEAGIDVLVDLNGYSSPDRLGIYMRKPAPNIVGWFNWYATTGIRAFDCIIGDSVVVPPGDERFYSERILRVSGTYLAFSVLYPVPEVVPPPCLRNRCLTFGCLAPQYKITDEVIAAWAQILGAAPAARLLLKNICLDDASNLTAVVGRFKLHGISPERLLLDGAAEHNEFLKAYNRIDIALDTFPYNGGTTNMEALWQGVPVLSFNGDRWASRISRSILIAAGFGDWIEPSREAYVHRAINLALSPQTGRHLARMRRTIRDRLARSSACDTATLCRELEEHFQILVSRPPGRVRPRGRL
jgi:protein O-GlcNAc transferase